MIKLFVDDIRKLPDDAWHVARTVRDAISALATLEVDEVSLDYDISHLITMDGCHRPYPCGESFEPVAHYIALMEKFCKESNSEIGSGLKITIHTSNYPGGLRMKRILEEVGLKPIMAIGSHNIANRLELEI